MADLTKLILPVKNTSTGIVINQEFNLPAGGGTGDMSASVYDSNNAVATAGGIAAYVSDQISTAVTSALTASY